MGGNLLGGMFGTKQGVNDGQNHGSEGAGIGSMLGLLASPLPGGSIWGPMLGGFLGGLFGGRIGKQSPPPQFEALSAIERNTRETVTAIENQTKMLTLSDRMMNVPAGFRIPSYALGGGAGMIVNSIQVNVQGGDPARTADAVVKQLREELRGQGKFRTTRSR